MVDQETNLHPKNNPSINLKPNIVTGNIPDKAVTFKKLDDNLQNRIEVNEANITKNTADIAKNTADIDDEASAREDEDERIREEVFQYVDNINSNLEEKISTNKTDIAKNTADIGSLTSKVSNLESDNNTNKTNIAKNTEDIAKKQDTITSSTDLTANSLTIKMDNYIYPAGIEPSEGDITISKDNINAPFREVYSFSFGHWRISNGKLSIIVCPLLYNATDTVFSHNFDWLGWSDAIILPQSVADKLIVIAHGGQNVISVGSVETQGIHSDGNAYPFDQLKLMYKIARSGNAIRIGFDLSKYEPLKIAAGTKYAFRLEENFVL